MAPQSINGQCPKKKPERSLTYGSRKFKTRDNPYKPCPSGEEFPRRGRRRHSIHNLLKNIKMVKILIKTSALDAGDQFIIHGQKTIYTFISLTPEGAFCELTDEDNNVLPVWLPDFIVPIQVWLVKQNK